MKFTSTNTDNDFIKEMCCVQCGESPFLEFKRTNGCVDVRMTTIGWSMIKKDNTYTTTCPMCLRRNKIMKLKNASH